MADDEELNTAKIDELKNALDDLKIVDVARKPEGISTDLKASADFMKKRDAILTLASRGFIVAMTKAGGDVEICSKEGEVRSLMKDGVEYVLRFGEIATDSDTGSAKSDEKDKEQKDGRGKRREKTFCRAESLSIRNGRVQSRDNSQAAIRTAARGQAGNGRKTRGRVERSCQT